MCRTISLTAIGAPVVAVGSQFFANVDVAQQAGADVRVDTRVRVRLVVQLEVVAANNWAWGNRGREGRVCRWIEIQESKDGEGEGG